MSPERSVTSTSRKPASAISRVDMPVPKPITSAWSRRGWGGRASRAKPGGAEADIARRLAAAAGDGADGQRKQRPDAGGGRHHGDAAHDETHQLAAGEAVRQRHGGDGEEPSRELVPQEDAGEDAGAEAQL